MKVVAISDTHCREVDLPEGDLLIVAGDITGIGSPEQVVAFNRYLEKQSSKFRHKPIVIAGNHDFLFQRKRQLAERILNSATYFQDESLEIDGIRIYGSPWTPTFFNWAFMKDRGADIRKVWDAIPEGLDILVTHGPPMGILDFCHGRHVGCEELLDCVTKRLTAPPRFHIFGHIHEGFGIRSTDNTQFINASICTGDYKPTNTPVVFEV